MWDFTASAQAADKEVSPKTQVGNYRLQLEWQKTLTSSHIALLYCEYGSELKIKEDAGGQRVVTTNFVA